MKSAPFGRPDRPNGARVNDYKSKIHDNGELTDIYLRGCENPESLTGDELARYKLLLYEYSLEHLESLYTVRICQFVRIRMDKSEASFAREIDKIMASES